MGLIPLFVQSAHGDNIGLAWTWAAPASGRSWTWAPGSWWAIDQDPTPQPATPTRGGDHAEIVRIGRGPRHLPSVVRDQTALLAANIDPSWVDMDCRELFGRHLPDNPAHVLNDADAAGLAEVRFGDPHARQGSVILLTFGTGIGSALLHDGLLYPNSELGHLYIGDTEAEHMASAAVKEREELSYKKWTKRVSTVLQTYEALFWPNLFVVGGGISRKHEKWVPLLKCKTPVVPAKLHNNAGIAGAALAAAEGLLP